MNNKQKNAKGKTNEKQNGLKFKARGGTAGAAGQMYESKVISLVVFRIVNDEDINEFHLASNIGDIGDLDDVCLKFTFNNKQVAVFVQAKHVDDLSKCITDAKLYNHKDKFYLNKYFDSYIKIRNEFDSRNDVMFNGEFKDVDCHFVIFTPVPNKIHRKKNVVDSPTFNKVKQLLNVTSNGEVFLLNYDETDIQLLTKTLVHERMESIGKSLVESVLAKTKFDSKMSAYIEQHYAVLVPEVLALSEENEGIYEVTINPELYFATDSLLIKLKEVIYREMLKRTKIHEENALNNLHLLLQGNISYLNELIGNVLHYDLKNNKLILDSNAPESIKELKDHIDDFKTTEIIVNAATETAGKEKLQLFKLHIPVNAINKIKEQNVGKDSPKGLKGESLHLREMAQDFLDHLYFYTKQGKEYEVGNTLVNEITNRKQYRIKYGIQAYTFFLKFHDQVQKWWIKTGSKYYFTKEYITMMLNKIPIENYVGMLNFNCRHEIDTYPIRFNDDFIQKFNSNINLTKVNVITTDSIALTSIKLYQNYIDRGIFIKYETISNFLFEEMKIFNDELKNNNQDKIFIVLIDRTFGDYKELHDILESVTSNIIIVSKHNVLYDNVNVFNDSDFNITDLTMESRDELLQYEIVSQGQTVQLRYILDELSLKLINKDIVLKIMNNEPINIGRKLTNPTYEEIKNLYVPRIMINERIRVEYMFHSVDEQWKYNLNTFKDIKNKVHVMTAKPGMGKSTTLTQLSLETKREYPEIWIVRINLLDFTDDFLEWKKENKSIELQDTIQLMLQSEMPSKIGKYSLKIDNERLIIADSKLNGVNLFSLELFVHCYNKGDMIFLFDGFDEICPNYQREVTEFINNLTKQEDSVSNTESDGFVNSDENCSRIDTKTCYQIWITSRPYNTIKQYLEDMFGDVLTLAPLTPFEQNLYYIKYWNTNVIIDDLNERQFANINSFFEYMSNMFTLGSPPNYNQNTLPSTCIPLKYMYTTAVEYFRSQIYRAPIDVDKRELLKKWVSRKLFVEGSPYVDDEHALEMNGVALHMYIIASLFTYEINKDAPTKPEDWDLERHTLTFFERYLEIKLNIRFENKNQMKTSKPDMMKLYNRERTEFIDNHKKMAFFAMFRFSHKILQTFLKNDVKFIKSYIKSIEKADERTGIIDRVKNGTPKFVHLVFAEYFCIEFIGDCIKNAKVKRNIIDFVVNHLLLYGTIGLRNVFDQKIKYDRKLHKILFSKEIKQLVFEYLIKQDMNMLATNNWDLKNVGDYERTMENALDKAIDNYLKNITLFLVSSIEAGITKANISDVLKFLGKGFFIGILYMREAAIIILILNKIREIDDTKLSEIVAFYEVNNEVQDTSNDAIIEGLKSELVGTPCYDFDAFD